MLLAHHKGINFKHKDKDVFSSHAPVIFKSYWTQLKTTVTFLLKMEKKKLYPCDLALSTERDMCVSQGDA